MARQRLVTRRTDRSLRRRAVANTDAYANTDPDAFADSNADACSADGDDSVACFRSNRGRHIDHDHGYRIPVRRDCHAWRHDSVKRRGRQQHHDHRVDAGSYRRTRRRRSH